MRGDSCRPTRSNSVKFASVAGPLLGACHRSALRLLPGDARGRRLRHARLPADVGPAQPQGSGQGRRLPPRARPGAPRRASSRGTTSASPASVTRDHDHAPRRVRPPRPDGVRRLTLRRRPLPGHPHRTFPALTRARVGPVAQRPRKEGLHRRQAMQGWCLDPETWQDPNSRLPPVPGHTAGPRRPQAAKGIRLRLGPRHPGRARFAARPIETAQPELVRRDWAARRANTWGRLARPGRIVHYAELRKLLIGHADHLAGRIDRV
jgi:hypothetical protein